ncbi:Hypothetical_protein [Hexamita inflata]|nr:Hypothetical protein HINF_LOCUS18511 [Hexamita inflata]CAI9969695.1 Hypothetical protein HINF_LOCUS57340 [Hexamita inflata]
MRDRIEVTPGPGNYVVNVEHCYEQQMRNNNLRCDRFKEDTLDRYFWVEKAGGKVNQPVGPQTYKVKYNRVIKSQFKDLKINQSNRFKQQFTDRMKQWYTQ